MGFGFRAAQLLGRGRMEARDLGRLPLRLRLQRGHLRTGGGNASCLGNADATLGCDLQAADWQHGMHRHAHAHEEAAHARLD